MKIQGWFFASAIAVGLAAIAGNPAAADTCLTHPNLRATEGGRWYYRVDRPTHRKCWYQRGSNTDASPSVRSRSLSLSPPADKSDGRKSLLSSLVAAVAPQTSGGAAESPEAPEVRSAEPARESRSRWRHRSARRGEGERSRERSQERSQDRRANIEQLRIKQDEADDSRALRAGNSRALALDPAVVQTTREDQRGFRMQSTDPGNARASVVQPEALRVSRTNQEAARVVEPKATGQEDLRTRGLKPDSGRGALVEPEDSPLNRFDWNGGQTRNVTSLGKGDRLLPKAVATVTEPAAPRAPLPASAPVLVNTGVSTLGDVRREGLFQEFLRLQERQGIRFW
jgi:hypothetical protein